jgi:hypothetical protein
MEVVNRLEGGRFCPRLEILDRLAVSYCVGGSGIFEAADGAMPRVKAWVSVRWNQEAIRWKCHIYATDTVIQLV